MIPEKCNSFEAGAAHSAEQKFHDPVPSFDIVEVVHQDVELDERQGSGSFGIDEPVVGQVHVHLESLWLELRKWNDFLLAFQPALGTRRVEVLRSIREHVSVGGELDFFRSDKD